MRPSGYTLGTALFLTLSTVPTGQGQGIPFRPNTSATMQTQPVNNPQTPPPNTAPKEVFVSQLQTLKNELKETKDRLHAFEAENEVLRRRNELSKQSLRTLNESLAIANAESELFRRQFGDQKLKMEALGLESVGDNKEALEQRLLKAVRDLGLVREEKDKLAEKLVALTEAVLVFLKAPVATPQIRMDVEAQMRSASQLLDDSANKAAVNAVPMEDLNGGMVVSVKEELSLLVANIGSRNGVKIGMPFQVTRGNQMVAKARVIDVRDRISGAVIEDLASATSTVKIGDHLQVDAQQ
jgi:hypothetical protein